MAAQLDLSPLFRSIIGLDRLSSAMENAFRHDAGGYPPYNIEIIGENNYRITMAVAGFDESELNIETRENVLTVTGERHVSENQEADASRFLHQGIAKRNFERRFQLADYVRVQNADLEQGLLHINLVREVPDMLKPRTIPIGQAPKPLKGQKVIEGKSRQLKPDED